MEWIVNHWSETLAIFWMAEKVTKVTPVPYDDILVDIIWGGLKKAVGMDDSKAEAE